MYTPEEIRQIFDEYQRRRALNIPITEEFARQLKDARVGVKDYTRELERSLNSLKSAGVGLFKSFKDGKEGASVYNDTLTTGADVIASFLKALGPLGWVLGKLVQGGAAYVAAVNEQSDQLFESYTQITQFGAGVSTGVDGVYRMSQQLGYSTQQLHTFADLVSENRLGFAIFGGTAEQGLRDYSGLVDSLRGYETEFRSLGLSITDVNQSVANYLRIQTFTGRSQIQSQDQLSRGAYNYIQQQMLVSRLTGQNAEMQKSAEQSMLDNNVFQVAQREMRKKQQAALAAGDTATAQRLEQQFNENIKLIKLMPESMRKGAMDVMTGYISASNEAEQFMRMAPEATRRIQSGQFDAIEVIDIASKEAGIGLDRFSGSLGKLGLLTDLLGEYSGIRDLELMTVRDSMATREAQAKQEIEQRKQVQDATSSYAAMLVEQRRIREAGQDAINLGLNAATAAMSGLTSAANAAATALGRGAPTPGRPAAPAPGAPAPAPAPGAPRGSTQSLLDLIGRVESNGNYNILVGGSVEPNLTNMTVAEVLEYQRGMLARGHESTAVGKYQIIRNTLSDLVKSGAVNPNEKFSQLTQDRLAIALLNRRGYQRYLQGELTADQFANRVAQEWASFPMPDGRSYYAGVGSNKALVDRSTVVSTLQGYRFGGVAAGPDSGYTVELHGTEAVVPLPDGRSIPVELSGYVDNVRNQIDVIRAQNSRLDDLISIMRTRNQISEKILRAYQS
jgi:hypothetical protein